MAGHQQRQEELEESFHFDEYGFKIVQEEDPTDDSLRCHVYSPQPGPAVSESWKSVCETWTRHNKESPKKLRLLLRKGLPRSLRSEVWKLFVNSSALKSQSSFDYQTSLSHLYSKLNAHHLTSHSTRSNVITLNAMIDKPCDENSLEEDDMLLKTWAKTTRQIMMDIIRTFPCHHLFLEPESPTKRSLFNILMLYSTDYNTDVGYCQGMSYVVALLLMNMEEEDAFWTAVSLFERKKYLAGYYDPSLSKIKTHADVFGMLLKDKFPQLATHLEGLGVHPLMYVTSWFMCLFTTLPCWDTVLTICDTLFLEGVNTIFKAALAIMEVCAPELVSMYRIEDVLPFLQHLPSRLVSLRNFSPVFWRTTVHNWEIEFFQDAVYNGGEGSSLVSTPRAGLKRPTANQDDVINEHEANRGRQPAAKRVKIGHTIDEQVQTPSSSQSIFDRLVNAITPARYTKPRPAATTTLSNTLPSMRNTSTARNRKTLSRAQVNQTPFKTPSTQVRRKRKLADDRLDLETPSKRVKPDIKQRDTESIYSPVGFKTPSTERAQRRKRQRDDGSSMMVEMKDFGSLRNQFEECDGSTSFTDFPSVTLVASHATPGSHSQLINGSTPTTQGGGPPSQRRSARIAKRRSVMEESLSVGSEYSLAPLSNHVQLAKVLLEDIQSTRNHRKFHAFKTFSTHKPVDMSQDTTSQEGSNSHDIIVKSPEVELCVMTKKQREL